MNKLKKFLLIFICMFLLTPSLSICANEDYLEWKQTDPRWKEDKIGSKTIGRVGCTSVSIAILLMHSGIMPNDFNPQKFVQEYKKAGGYANNSFYFTVIDSYTDGNFKYKGDTGKGSRATLEELNKLFNKGYYITICMFNNKRGGGTHWIACLDASSTDPSKIRVADPAYNSKTLKEACANSKNNGKDLRFVYYECTKSKSTERVNSSGSSSNNIDKIETVTDGSNIIDLGNGKSGLVDPMTGEIYELQENAVELVDLDDVDKNQLKGVTDWKQNIENEGERGKITFLRTIVVFVGICFIVWVVLIYLCYWYDRINNIIDIELLPIITAGRLKVSPEETNCSFDPKGITKGSPQTVTHKVILSICLIGLAFAVLIITGKIYDLISFCVKKILGLLGRW